MLGLMLKVLLWHIILVVAIAVYPWSIEFSPTPYEVTIQPLEGGLSQNTLLESVEFLHRGKFLGPESLDIFGETIYTGVYGGYILAIGGTGIHKITRIGRECNGLYDQELCGRILGLRVNYDGTKLLVADAYHGIYMVDTESGDSSLIIPRGVSVEGKKLQLFNDIVSDSKGVIYFTESSNKYPLYKIVWAIMEHDASGRVMAYDPVKRDMRVLLDGLVCPNGIQLTHDGKALLVSETGNFRILRYYLEGEKKGTYDVFAQNLPGEPDNIRKSLSGGYWVAFVNGRSQRTLFDLLARYPFVKLGLIRLTHAVGAAVHVLASLWNSTGLYELAAYFSNGWVFYDQIPKYGMIVELDATGTIKRSLHASSGRINFISEVLEHDNYLYLGSFRNDFIGKVKLD
ncbi:adipocyte plasma membrane-associated protein-like [Varroa destructor]|uniref:Strictosidine synthase conserved region domain-containing protein n=1 Tax=Varroa destructor TaxID=109461 RepID=A0A7M7JSS2_VARDE|nr:adipocyte plasma membrane-associated protein-like [Varroa destructor]XP_022650613.1 adipocyte plasma membrane-associated protein-like [Varroa destructor]XP_022650614.1 adipocyte plasma membrane-associated protein-like [Varroa destructor]